MTKQELAEAARKWDRDAQTEYVAAAARERGDLLQRFPRKSWPQLPLDRYALGMPGKDDTYCRWLEFQTPHCGSIRGNTAQKMLIYSRSNGTGFWYRGEYASTDEAWSAIRAGYVKLLDDAASDRLDALDDESSPLWRAPMARLKTLYVYFPERFIPIYSQAHLVHYLRALGRSEDERSYEVVRLNRALLQACRENLPVEKWSPIDIAHFLYSTLDPREQPRVVKIAPGDGAMFWDDCRRERYICVGWDEVGDLREFDSFDDFFEKFRSIWGNQYKNATRTKAKELWTLRELEPGDRIVANKGESRVLAVGSVTGDYRWEPARGSYRHVVPVEWNERYAHDIPQQKRWGMVTVGAVTAKLWDSIVSRTDGSAPPRVVEDEQLLNRIAQALERKKQVIIYGPPGTGKTYAARRFAVYWLIDAGDREARAATLADAVRFSAAERNLAAAQEARRVWWVVANPAQWSWDKLQKEKTVKFHEGRLQRNYGQLSPGDLVLGYHSTPQKRLVAVARVTRGFGRYGPGKPFFELEFVSLLSEPIRHEELEVDRVVKLSEPFRMGLRGTLFALTAEEAEHLLELIEERNPALRDYLRTGRGAGALTRLTFHPSYSYEDFVEGFRPKQGESDSLTLTLQDGVFKRICAAAIANPEQRFLILIDEINRANLAKVFGELITVLEADKRGLAVTLPQSKETFRVPENVFLLGTMNTADRSIKLFDAAMRRRFAFIELMPDLAPLRGATVGPLALDLFLEELNRRIARKEGREKQIGHSFLLEGSEPVSTPAAFADRFRHDLLPLLQEYCYEDYGTLATYLGPKLVDAERHVLDESLLGDPADLLDALHEEMSRTTADEA